ncbi:MAG: FHA domain-containing protein [Saprospiraceae bacterium]|nr:FHA domain-containing protein [Saprospiraceae bacterium]MBK9728132.1 FHA domain-containing protein [Saprospiraceae bacterium]
MSTNTTTLNPHKQGLAKTIGQGISTIGGSSSVFYTLFYLDGTVSKQAGDHDTVVVSEIFLGRDRDCLVRYGDTRPTVSRKHAVLRWENGVVVLHHLSKTNSTYVNDQEVFGQRPLQNGDVIKLSSDGPRMRFNVAEPGQGVRGMRMTERLSLFAKQGLRPYRNAIVILSALLLIAASFATYYAVKTNDQIEVLKVKQKEIDVLSNKMTDSEKELNKLESQNSDDANRINDLKSQINRYKTNIDVLRNDVRNLDNKTTNLNHELITNSNNTTTQPEVNTTQVLSENPKSSYDNALEELEKDIYYVYVERIEIINSKGELAEVKLNAEWEFWGATGFMTKDGDFITARHVIEPWKYFNPELKELSTSMFGPCSLIHLLSICEFNNINFTVYYKALSKNGNSFTFTNKECNSDPSKDYISKTDEALDKCSKTLADLAKSIFKSNLKKYNDFKSSKRGYTDWTAMRMHNIKSNLEMSRDIIPIKGETLFTLGYPLLSSIQENFDKSKLEPALGTMVVSQGGAKNNVTNVSNHSFTPGNSGGPVFVKRNGKYICVGLVSAASNGIGFVVPCANVR